MFELSDTLHTSIQNSVELGDKALNDLYDSFMVECLYHIIKRRDYRVYRLSHRSELLLDVAGRNLIGERYIHYRRETYQVIYSCRDSILNIEPVHAQNLLRTLCQKNSRRADQVMSIH